MALKLRPITLAQAKEFVGKEHRHHPPPVGHKFSVAVADQDGTIRGVAIAGRPVARGLDNGERLEVVRLATDGTPNACSMLYGACARAGVALGYERHNICTYILASEPGTSLKAAGWVKVADTKGGEWDTPTRRRKKAAHPTEPKQRWHAAPPVYQATVNN